MSTRNRTRLADTLTGNIVNKVVDAWPGVTVTSDDVHALHTAVRSFIAIVTKEPDGAEGRPNPADMALIMADHEGFWSTLHLYRDPSMWHRPSSPDVVRLNLTAQSLADILTTPSKMRSRSYDHRTWHNAHRDAHPERLAASEAS